MKKLSEKEHLFCSYYSNTRNPREAAAKAGYSLRPERSAIKLLGRKEILDEIKKIDGKRISDRNEVVAGYRRLAFGTIADAIKLLFCGDEMEDADIEKLDLFCISDIKRPKGGGMEIKFFDRIKALERLQTISDATEADSAVPFYEAIELGARALSTLNGEQGNG